MSESVLYRFIVPSVRLSLFAILFGSMLSGHAMTLGRVRGVALVGQGLDVSIPVQIDAEESAAGLCAEADVFHADTLQEPSRIRVTTSSSQQPQTVNVRVVSAHTIDEPVVTIYLKVGCVQKVSRRYVLLADFPSEASPQASPVAAVPATSPLSSIVETPVASSSNKSGLPSVDGRQVVAKTTAVVPRPVPRRVKPVTVDAAKVPDAVASTQPSSKTTPTKEAKTVTKTGQPRLQLDPLEALAERITTLEMTRSTAPSDVASAPSPSASAPDARMEQDLRRLQSLEGDVKALLALAAKNEASLLEMKTRLHQAESERFANWLVYTLMGSVLLCLAAVWALWNRQKTLQSAQGDWWRGDESAKLNAANTASAKHAVVRPPSNMESGPVSTVDLQLTEVSASTFDSLMQSDATPQAKTVTTKPTEAKHSADSDSRHINPDDLLDIRQKGEFYVSLGQVDNAIHILEDYIGEHPGSSPILYLDLIQLFHSQNLKTDYRQYREDFNLLFNARIPEFALFKQEGRGLEAYPEVLADIRSLWTSSQVLILLEACIFHNAWDDAGPRFDLAAFRELLLLYAVAQEVHDPSLSRPHSNAKSSFASLATARETGTSGVFDLEDSQRPDAELEYEEPGPSRFAETRGGLDIDLDFQNTLGKRLGNSR